MKEIPTVLRSDEILDKVLKRASAVSVKYAGSKLLTEKNKTMAKIDCVASNINQIFLKYEKHFPTIEKLNEFQKELLDILVGCQQLHHALGAIKWCNQTVKKISASMHLRVKKAGNIEDLEKIRKEYYGRVASLIKQIAPELEFLNHARDVILKIPSIDMNLPTIVISGFPNVGKSTLVKRISSAEPDIAPYPFTTKGLIIGHAKFNMVEYQFIDTPGLLDRPVEQRNAIEKQAIVALKHLADVIVFLIDPTGYSGTVEEQEKLLASLRREFGNTVFIVVETKADILRRKNSRLKISAETGEGIEKLIERIREKFKETKKYAQIIEPQNA